MVPLVAICVSPSTDTRVGAEMTSRLSTFERLWHCRADVGFFLFFFVGRHLCRAKLNVLELFAAAENRHQTGAGLPGRNCPPPPRPQTQTETPMHSSPSSLRHLSWKTAQRHRCCNAGHAASTTRKLVSSMEDMI